MRVQVTKVLASALNKALKTRKKGDIYTSIGNFEYDTASTDTYIRMLGTDTALNNESYDFDYGKNCFKFIRIQYNANCYALDNIITTTDLLKAFKACDHTLDSFINEIFNEYEI